MWDDALPSSQPLSSFFRAVMHGFEAGVSGRGNAVARGTCRPLFNMSEYENGYYSVPGPALDHFGMFRAFSVLSAGGFGRWTAGEPRNTNPVSGLGFHVWLGITSAAPFLLRAFLDIYHGLLAWSSLKIIVQR